MTDIAGRPAPPRWRFFIDRGGTFTDIVARCSDGRTARRKLLSENGAHTGDAAIAGIRDILGLSPDRPIPAHLIECVRMGTTVATNALLERRGERTLLLVNEGFADALRIGNQARPRLFDLNIVLPEMLYEIVREVPGRIGADGSRVTALDEEEARRALHDAAARGIRACAIALIHAWKYPEDERRLAMLAREAGFSQVSASHEVSPLLRLIPRAETTVLDAYLSPVLRRHVERLTAELPGVRLGFMQSHGGLAAAGVFRCKDAVLSGPAGGIVGAVRSAAPAGLDRVISFDMGGTSTDVALYAGAFERRLETEIAGVRIRTPMMAINTIAAGGGSVLHFDGERCRVGPDSAGADPGPAAYRRGGPLTVTDANVCVGKIQPRHFPALFGASGDQRLDAEAVHEGFAALAARMPDAAGTTPDVRDAAEGFLRIAVSNMANAIREISVRKGHDLARFALHCFGGAGGQHACLVADALEMDTVLIHPLAGVLSAYGIGLADQVAMRAVAVEQRLDEAVLSTTASLADRLADEACGALVAQGADAARVRAERRLHLRTEGTEAALLVPLGTLEATRAAFAEAHLGTFGFTTPERPLVVEAVEIEAIGTGDALQDVPIEPRGTGGPAAIENVEIWSGGRAHRAPVFDRVCLRAGDRIAGPALLIEANATTMVEPGWTAEVTELNHMFLRRTERRVGAAASAPRADPVMLEVFNNLLMSVAEQAGIALQNTATSVNIKERLDFSCAIFDAGGNLVANAPHVPVHLGAMSDSVRSVLRRRAGTLRPGDVVALNDPANGGTHLPDVTVITPMFEETGREIRLLAACRGHHADIGGTTPGSTPPDSRSLRRKASSSTISSSSTPAICARRSSARC